MTHPYVWHIFPPKKKIVTNARAISEAVTRSVSDCAPLFFVTVSFFGKKANSMREFMNDCALYFFCVRANVCFYNKAHLTREFRRDNVNSNRKGSGLFVFCVRANIYVYKRANWTREFRCDNVNSNRKGSFAKEERALWTGCRARRCI